MEVGCLFCTSKKEVGSSTGSRALLSSRAFLVFYHILVALPSISPDPMASLHWPALTRVQAVIPDDYNSLFLGMGMSRRCSHGKLLGSFLGPSCYKQLTNSSFRVVP